MVERILPALQALPEVERAFHNNVIKLVVLFIQF